MDKAADGDPGKDCQAPGDVGDYDVTVTHIHRGLWCSLTIPIGLSECGSKEARELAWSKVL